MQAKAIHTRSESLISPLSKWVTALVRVPSGGVLGIVCLYVVLIPSLRLLPVAEGYDGKRILEVVLLLGTAGWLMVRQESRDLVVRTFMTLPRAGRWFLGALVALGGVSALRAPLLAYALLDVGHYILLAMLVISIAGVCSYMGSAVDQLVIGTVMAAACLYLISFSVNYLMHVGGLAALWPRGAIGFSHVRFFNQWQTWTLPLMVVPLAMLPNRATGLRWAVGCLAAFWWMLLIASGGRGTSMAMIVAALVVLVVFGRRARHWMLWQGAALMGGAVLYGLLFKVLASSEFALIDRNLAQDTGRLILWPHAWEAILETPWLGIGPMHLAFFPHASINAHPHNIVLQWAAEWGVPAAVLLVSLAAWGLWGWMRHTRGDRRAGREPERSLLRVALTASLVAGGVHAMFSGLLIMPLSQMWFALLVGWAWSMMHDETGARTHVTRTQSVLARLCLVVAIGMVGWGVSSDVTELEVRQEEFAEVAGAKILRPRYWQQGFIGYESGRYSEELAQQE